MPPMPAQSSIKACHHDAKGSSITFNITTAASRQAYTRRLVMLSVPMLDMVARQERTHAAQVDVSSIQGSSPQSRMTVPVESQAPTATAFDKYEKVVTGFTFRSQDCSSADAAAATERQASRKKASKAAVVNNVPVKCTDGISVSARLHFARQGAVPELTGGTANVVVLLAPGFLVESRAYDSYLQSVLSQGCHAATYDLRQTALSALDDIDEAQVVLNVMDWCKQQIAASQSPPSSDANNGIKFILAGHSRGAKVCCLAALMKTLMPDNLHASTASPGTYDDTEYTDIITTRRLATFTASTQGASSVEDNRWAELQQHVIGLTLIDPVDFSFEATVSPRRPSAVQLLHELGVQRKLPTLIVGAGRNGDCVPSKANYKKFWDAARSPSVLLELKDGGHFSFLDYQTTLQQSVCSNGRMSAADVRGMAQNVMKQFVSLCVFGRMDMLEQSNLTSIHDFNGNLKSQVFVKL